MVVELTPPTLFVVVVNIPVPLPLTSPVNVINWSPELTPPTVTSPTTVNVVFVLVPPAMVKPFANAVGLTPLMVLFVRVSVPLKVAMVPLVGNVIFVFAVVFSVVVLFPAVLKSPANEIDLPPILLTKGDSAFPPKSPVNWSLPFVVAVASGVAASVILETTKAVVAICSSFVVDEAVGALGVPVNVGDAMVARNNISAVFAVMLEVLDVILVLKAFSAFVALVTSAVILAVFELILVSNPASAFVALVISAVMLDVLDVILVLKASSAFVALVISAVMLEVLDVILVSNPASAFVALVTSAVMLDVLEAINVGKVPMVVELTPPTLFTVGKSAVPPRSLVNCNLPFLIVVASGVASLDIFVATNAVVAIWSSFEVDEAVGAVGVPVNAGLEDNTTNPVPVELLVPVPPLAILNGVVKLNVPDDIAVAVIVPAAKLPVPSLFIIVFAVLFEVADNTEDATVAIVDELTSPTLFTVVEKVPNPAPVTSPFNDINWSPVFVPPNVTSVNTVNVFVLTVPPVKLNPSVNEEGVSPLIVLLVRDSVPLKVAMVPLVGSVILVLSVVVMVVV